MANKPTINDEIRRLCGIGPRYNFTEAADSSKGTTAHSSKEWEGAPATKKDGGDVGAGTGNKEAGVGGTKDGPGVNNLAKNAPKAKETGDVGAGTGNKEAGVGGTKEGPGQNDKTKAASSADKEGGEVDDGGGAKTAKAGGATDADIKKKDDGLRAEHREHRFERMSALIEMVDSL